MISNKENYFGNLIFFELVFVWKIQLVSLIVTQKQQNMVMVAFRMAYMKVPEKCAFFKIHVSWTQKSF